MSSGSFLFSSCFFLSFFLLYHICCVMGRFNQCFLKLLPTLSKEDIIVMDNMRSHHAKVVKQLLDSSKVTYLYLPPYSPDLNPIEKMWSKLKAFLRKEKIRIASELPSAISKGFLTIRPKDCIGWFHSCDYVQ